MVISSLPRTNRRRHGRFWPPILIPPGRAAEPRRPAAILGAASTPRRAAVPVGDRGIGLAPTRGAPVGAGALAGALALAGAAIWTLLVEALPRAP